jgi:hypothetical protein
MEESDFGISLTDYVADKQRLHFASERLKALGLPITTETKSQIDNSVAKFFMEQARQGWIIETTPQLRALREEINKMRERLISAAPLFQNGERRINTRLMFHVDIQISEASKNPDVLQIRLASLYDR